MYLTTDNIASAVICAQQVLRDPRVYAGNESLLPISVDTVRDVIAEVSRYNIEMRSVVFEGQRLFGRIERYAGNRAVIDVKDSLSQDWKRFIAVKELMHLIIDGDDALSPYGDQTLEKLVQDGHIGIVSQNGDRPPAQSELIAEVAAMEVLYPIQVREEHAAQLVKKETTIAKLSLMYGLPGHLVETAVSTRYLALIVDCMQTRVEQARNPAAAARG